MKNQRSGNSPLHDLRVLDLSRILGGPFCTQILADLGAQITKIEPITGDETRRWGPPFKKGESAYFTGINRGKRSLALNLTTKQGQAILSDLLKNADVLVENFKPGTLKKWGFGNLQKRFPNLVHVSITGFGEKGPLGQFAGYDAAAQGWSGLMSVNGEPIFGSQRIGIPIVDLASGLYSAIAVLSGVYARSSTKKGGHYKTSLYEVGLSLLFPHAANYLMSGQVASPVGSAHTNICPYDLFKTKTGHIFLAVGSDLQFQNLCRALALPALAKDQRFLTNALRLKNQKVLKKNLEKKLIEFGATALARRLLRAGVPCGPVLDAKQALLHAQTKSLKMVIEKNDYRGVRIPLSWDGERPKVQLPPALSEHSIDILKDLRYSKTKIAELRKKGVIL